LSRSVFNLYDKPEIKESKTGEVSGDLKRSMMSLYEQSQMTSNDKPYHQDLSRSVFNLYEKQNKPDFAAKF
jgi:hypothetical protein